jgi:hypothetical protein
MNVVEIGIPACLWSSEILRSNSRGLTLTRPAATLSHKERENNNWGCL